MKALKEKRLSLRSLIRGGLVILSLFALVFAIGCNTSSDPDPGPGPGPGTDPTTAPVVPYVTGISVMGKPTNPSFQGLAPDLTGVTAQVIWSNSTQAQYINGEDLAKNGFYATSYCDIPGDDTVVPQVQIAHKGSQVLSNKITLPGVVSLVTGGLTFTGSGLDWYADQRPDFAKLGLSGRYEWIVDDVTGEVLEWGNTALTSPVPAGQTKKAASYPIPITDGYPAMDKTNVVKSQLIKVGIGEDNTVTVGQPGWIYDGGVATSTPSTGKGYKHYAEVTIGKYYWVHSIEFASPEGDFYAFDDDTDLNDQNVDVNDPLSNKKGNNVKLAKVKASKLRFNVRYSDGTTVTAAKTISWNDFYANVGYTLGKEPPSDYLFPFAGAMKYAPAAPNNGNVPDTLAIDDESLAWDFQLRYVPIEYGDPNYTTYRGIVSVPLPVYAFEGLNPATPKTTIRLMVMYNAVADSMDNLMEDTDRQLIDAINDTWELRGNYERNGDIKTKPLKFTADMFNKANVAIASGNKVLLSNPAMVTEVGTLSGVASSGTKYVLANGKGFILPFKYNTEQLDSEDDAVIVDIYYLVP